MSVRVYELAKELGLSSKLVREFLGAMGVVAKSHSSTVDDSVAQKLKEAVERGTVKEAQTPARPARPKRPTRSAAAPAKRPSAERTAPPPSAERPVQRAPAPVQKPAPQPAPAAPAAAAVAATPEAAGTE